MDIALLNVRVTVQKSMVTVDDNGNHMNAWSDYYSCHATVGGEGGKEKDAGSITVDDSNITFSMRYCRKMADVTNTGYRILFHEEIYNILSVDHMNFKRKSIKLRCQKERR